MTRYFVYGRDRVGAHDLKVRLTEEHWAYMDGYEAVLIARGPTLTEDGERTTGSLHIVELADVEAARAFAYEEPYYQAGVFESVLVCRYADHLGRTMWDVTGLREDYGCYLVLTDDGPPPVSSEHLIAYGDLLSLDDDTRLGRAAFVEAPDIHAAAALLGGAETDVHPWEFGGRRG